MKVIITESQYSRAVDHYISHLLEPHEVKTDEEYPNSIFWIKDGNVIVEIQNSEYFWVDSNIWGSIARMFDLEYDETKSVIKIWLEQHYNVSEITVEYPWPDYPDSWDTVIMR